MDAMVAMDVIHADMEKYLFFFFETPQLRAKAGLISYALESFSQRICFKSSFSNHFTE